MHGPESAAFGGAGYRGAGKREEAQGPTAFVALQPAKRKTLNTASKRARSLQQAERLKASVRAKVEHPFRVVKQPFGDAKLRCRGGAKSSARLTMLFALSPLWMARRQVLVAQG